MPFHLPPTLAISHSQQVAAWRRRIQYSIALIALASVLARPISGDGAGLTVVTHGYGLPCLSCPQPVWVDAMGDYIADIADRSGGTAAIYRLDINRDQN